MKGYKAGEAETGIEVDPDHWRKGYATEVLSALIDLARKGKVKRFVGITRGRNFRAIELMKAHGFEIGSQQDGNVTMVRRFNGKDRSGYDG